MSTLAGSSLRIGNQYKGTKEIKTRSGSGLTLGILGGTIFMLGLFASVLDDPIIYSLVIGILVFGLGTIVVNFINALLDLRDRLETKDA